MIVIIIMLWVGGGGSHGVSGHTWFLILQTCSVPPDYRAFKQNISPHGGVLQVSHFMFIRTFERAQTVSE